jgi:hypothetical protein
MTLDEQSIKEIEVPVEMRPAKGTRLADLFLVAFESPIFARFSTWRRNACPRPYCGSRPRVFGRSFLRGVFARLAGIIRSLAVCCNAL